MMGSIYVSYACCLDFSAVKVAGEFCSLSCSVEVFDDMLISLVRDD